MQENVQIEFLTDYSEICGRLGRHEINEMDLSTLPLHQRMQIACSIAIKNLEDYFNGDWIPNWDDENERKWYPYHRKSSGGWVFYASYYRYGTSDGEVGFYKDQKTSDHVGKHFIKFYIGIAEKSKKRQNISVQL